MLAVLASAALGCLPNDPWAELPADPPRPDEPVRCLQADRPDVLLELDLDRSAEAEAGVTIRNTCDAALDVSSVRYAGPTYDVDVALIEGPRLRAGQAATVSIVFRPDGAGEPDEGEVLVHVPEQDDLRISVVSHAGRAGPVVSELAWGWQQNVPVGCAVELPVWVSNTGTLASSLHGFELLAAQPQGSESAWSWVDTPPLPLPLPPRDDQGGYDGEIVLRFAPLTPGEHQAELGWSFANERGASSRLTVEASARGGLPSVDRLVYRVPEEGPVLVELLQQPEPGSITVQWDHGPPVEDWTYDADLGLLTVRGAPPSGPRWFRVRYHTACVP